MDARVAGPLAAECPVQACRAIPGAMSGQGRTALPRPDCGGRQVAVSHRNDELHEQPARGRYLLNVSNVARGAGGLDPDSIQTAADFARALQALRDRSGLKIREVARLTGGQRSTVGGYFSGQHLPLDRELLTRLLTVCGEERPGADRTVAAGAHPGAAAAEGGVARHRTGGSPATRRPTRSGSSAGRMSPTCSSHSAPRRRNCPCCSSGRQERGNRRCCAPGSCRGLMRLPGRSRSSTCR